ncbi:hypothetical protein J3F83DRAFT_740317 [Trichoderma novae-zelandiae]
MLCNLTQSCIPLTSFLDPVLEGHEIISRADMALLIENEALGKMALFNLGHLKGLVVEVTTKSLRSAGLLCLLG